MIAILGSRVYCAILEWHSAEAHTNIQKQFCPRTEKRKRRKEKEIHKEEFLKVCDILPEKDRIEEKIENSH